MRDTEIRVIFKRPPKLAFSSNKPDPDELICESIPDRAQLWSSK